MDAALLSDLPVGKGTEPDVGLYGIKQVRQTSQDVLGEDHPDTIGATISLGIAYLARYQTDEADEADETGEVERLLTDAVQRSSIRLGPDHPTTLIGKHFQAVARAGQGRV